MAHIMKKFLMPILAVFSLVNSVSATSILSDNCDCSHPEDGRKLSRKLVNTTESENLIANTAKNLQSSIKFITEYVLNSEDDSFKEQNFVLHIGLMIDFMDENSEFYNHLREIYSKLQPFSAKSSPTLTNEQKDDLKKLISENYPQIIDIVSKINNDLKTHARKKCVCKMNLKNSLTDIEFALQRADKDLSDRDIYNAYLKIESGCSSLKYMTDESAPEYQILGTLYSYLHSQSSKILSQSTGQEELGDTEAENYIKIYNEEKETILEIIGKLKTALTAPEEPSEEERLRNLYDELVKEHNAIGTKIQTVGERLRA